MNEIDLTELNVGDIVRVTSECKTIGCEGIITKIVNYGKYRRNFRANVVFTRDELISKGINDISCTTMQYSVKSLTKILDEVNSNIINVSEKLNDFYIVAIHINQYSRKDYFLCPFTDVKIGDKVICEYQENIPTVLAVYKSLEEAKLSKLPTKEIICIVDYSKIRAKRSLEKQISSVQHEIYEKIKAVNKTLSIEFYASKDPSIAVLQDSLDNLKRTAKTNNTYYK